jgi:hypothetical protein
LKWQSQFAGWTLLQLQNPENRRFNIETLGNKIYPPALRAFLRYNLFVWGRIILGAVIVVLVVVWLAAIWIYFMDPRVFLQKLPTW